MPPNAALEHKRATNTVRNSRGVHELHSEGEMLPQ